MRSAANGPRVEPSPIRVLVADDHPIVRQGLRNILADTSDVVVVGEATDAREVLEQLRRTDFDVVLLDLMMPGTTGLDLLESVLREQPRLPVLVLSMHPEDQYALRVFRAGAAGYLTKESAPEVLVQAIRKVHGGGKWVTASLAEKLATSLGRPADRLPHETLSNREHQVLCLLARAKSVKDIGQELHLSEKTISTYRARVLEKLDLRTTADLIRYAIQNHLVD
jgi:two-component system invasion response regulator UvrY